MDLIQRRKAMNKRSEEDFDFMVLCESKGNMGMYRLLKDTELEKDREELRLVELFFGIER